MSTEKEVTIYDIAARLNISPATVSRGLKDHPAISKKTKKKIFELADEIGYRSNHFARNLRNQKTNTIGVIAPKLNSHFMSSVIAGIERVANSKGFNLVISQSSESAAKEAANARTLFNNRVDGLLVSLAFDTVELSHFEPFFRKNIPVVFFDRVMLHSGSLNVQIDNRKAAYDATMHLIEQGCRQLVHVTAPQVQNVYVDRLKGFKDALAEAGLKFRKEQLFIGDLSLESGRNIAESVLQLKQRPDGIFVSNDNCAVGLMLGLKKAGIAIPKDMAVVGFNNDPLCNVVEPNLSSVNYAGYEMGEAAAQNLIQHLTGHAPIQQTDTILMRSDLVIRASSLHRNTSKKSR